MEKHIAPWQILESRMSYEDRWLRVRSDTCRTAQGYIVEPYHVMEYLDWVNVLALTTDGQVITVREYRHGVGQVLRGLPGGGVETRDQSPLAAMQRELLEETGYGGGQFFGVGQSFPNTGNQNNTLWSFLAVGVVKLQGQQLDEAEHIEIVLQDFAEFNQEVWSGAIPLQSLHLATIGLASHFIKQSKLPELEVLRRALQQR
jgi:ADP-ribose pyrophosphatase